MTVYPAIAPVEVVNHDVPQKTPPDDEPDDVLTADAVAQMLHVHANTVRAMAGRGEIPGRKVGRAWRFSRTAIQKWLDPDS